MDQATILVLKAAFDAQRGVLGEVCYQKLMNILAKAQNQPGTVTAEEMAMLQQVADGNLTECQKASITTGGIAGVPWYIWVIGAVVAYYAFSD